jgi:hypothetical protein
MAIGSKAPPPHGYRQPSDFRYIQKNNNVTILARTTIIIRDSHCLGHGRCGAYTPTEDHTICENVLELGTGPFCMDHCTHAECGAHAKYKGSSKDGDAAGQRQGPPNCSISEQY